MRVPCEVKVTDENGVDVASAECSRCGHCTLATVLSDEEKALRHALAMLRNECPEGESNYYYDGDEE